MKFLSYCIIPLFALVFVSCNEDQDEAPLPAHHQLNAYDNYDELSTIRTTIYEQLQYDLAYLEPYEFVPADLRTEYRQKVETERTRFQDKHLPEVLATYVADGTISQNFSDAYYPLVQAYVNAEDPNDFTAAGRALERELTNIRQNPLLEPAEKKQLYTMGSVLQGANRYFAEAGLLLPDVNGLGARDGCTWKESWSCIKEYTGYGMIVGFVGGIGTGPGGGLVFGAGTSIGFLVGVIQVLRGDNGPCCEALDCHVVLGVSQRFEDCTPTATYRAYGFGADDTSLDWTNVGGTPVSANTPTSNPRLEITQTNTGTPVNTTIASVCVDGTSETPTVSFERDLFALVREVNGVNLLGPDQIYPGETYTYTGYGISANANYTTQWFIQGGQIISSSRSSATVRWNEGMAEGRLQLQVNNQCPGGEHELHTIMVTGDGPIP